MLYLLLQGLQFIAENIKVGEADKLKPATISQKDMQEKPMKTTILRSTTIHRSFPGGISHRKDGIALWSAMDSQQFWLMLQVCKCSSAWWQRVWCAPHQRYPLSGLEDSCDTNSCLFVEPVFYTLKIRCRCHTVVKNYVFNALYLFIFYI